MKKVEKSNQTQQMQLGIRKLLPSRDGILQEGLMIPGFYEMDIPASNIRPKMTIVNMTSETLYAMASPLPDGIPLFFSDSADCDYRWIVLHKDGGGFECGVDFAIQMEPAPANVQSLASNEIDWEYHENDNSFPEEPEPQTLKGIEEYRRDMEVYREPLEAAMNHARRELSTKLNMQLFYPEQITSFRKLAEKETKEAASAISKEAAKESKAAYDNMILGGNSVGIKDAEQALAAKRLYKVKE